MDKVKLWELLWQINYFAYVIANTKDEEEKTTTLTKLKNATANIYKENEK